MTAKELRAITNEINAKVETTKEENARKYVEEIVIPKLEREARLGLCKYQIVIPYQFETYRITKVLEKLGFKVEYKSLGNLLIKW